MIFKYSRKVVNEQLHKNSEYENLDKDKLIIL
jgi:hypothetical protein